MTDNAIEVERTILGGVLSGPVEVFDQVVAVLRPDHWADSKHVKIFTTLQEMRVAGLPLERLALREYLANEIEDAGGVGYIDGLIAVVIPDTNSISRYAEILRESAAKRRLITIGKAMIKAAESRQSASSIAARGMEALAKGVETSASGLASITQILSEVTSEVEMRMETGVHFRGLRTISPSLDAVTQGYQPEQMYLVGAASSAGKTALAQASIMTVLEAHVNVRIAAFSLEMSRFSIGTRYLSAKTGVPLELIRSGLLDQVQADLVFSAAAEMGRLIGSRLMTNTRRVSMADIAAECRALSRSRLDMIVVDYIQLVSGTARERKDLELRGIARDLLDLGKELRVPVLTFAQLTGEESMRPPAFRPERRDLRDAKALYDEARVAIWMSRPWIWAKQDKRYRPCFLRLVIDKQSEGPAYEDIDLHFDGGTQRIVEEDCTETCRHYSPGPPIPPAGVRKKKKSVTAKSEIQQALALAAGAGE